MVLRFTFLGPLVGATVVWVMLSVATGFKTSFDQSLMDGYFVSVSWGYLFGTVPAFLAGIFYGVIADGLDSWARLPAGAICGFIGGKLVESLLMVTVGVALDFGDFIRPSLLSAPGSVSGLLCVAVFSLGNVKAKVQSNGSE